MSEQIVIKRMETPAETEGKAQVHYRSWQQTYRGQLSDDYLDNMSCEQCLAIAKRWQDNVIIAKDGERVVGFTVYGQCRDRDMENTGEVLALYLLEEYQKRGIGYRLMQAAMEQLASYPAVALWVLKGNEKAIPFYLRYGFRFDGAQKQLLIGQTVSEQRMIFSREI